MPTGQKQHYLMEGRWKILLMLNTSLFRSPVPVLIFSWLATCWREIKLFSTPQSSENFTGLWRLKLVMMIKYWNCNIGNGALRPKYILSSSLHVLCRIAVPSSLFQFLLLHGHQTSLLTRSLGLYLYTISGNVSLVVCSLQFPLESSIWTVNS